MSYLLLTAGLIVASIGGIFIGYGLQKEPIIKEILTTPKIEVTIIENGEVMKFFPPLPKGKTWRMPNVFRDNKDRVSISITNL